MALTPTPFEKELLQTGNDTVKFAVAATYVALGGNYSTEGIQERLSRYVDSTGARIFDDEYIKAIKDTDGEVFYNYAQALGKLYEGGEVNRASAFQDIGNEVVFVSLEEAVNDVKARQDQQAQVVPEFEPEEVVPEIVPQTSRSSGSRPQQPLAEFGPEPEVVVPASSSSSSSSSSSGPALITVDSIINDLGKEGTMIDLGRRLNANPQGLDVLSNLRSLQGLLGKYLTDLAGGNKEVAKGVFDYLNSDEGKNFLRQAAEFAEQRQKQIAETRPKSGQVVTSRGRLTGEVQSFLFVKPSTQARYQTLTQKQKNQENRIFRDNIRRLPDAAIRGVLQRNIDLHKALVAYSKLQAKTGLDRKNVHWKFEYTVGTPTGNKDEKGNEIIEKTVHQFVISNRDIADFEEYYIQREKELFDIIHARSSKSRLKRDELGNVMPARQVDVDRFTKYHVWLGPIYTGWLTNESFTGAASGILDMIRNAARGDYGRFANLPSVDGDYNAAVRTIGGQPGTSMIENGYAIGRASIFLLEIAAAVVKAMRGDHVVRGAWYEVHKRMSAQQFAETYRIPADFLKFFFKRDAKTGTFTELLDSQKNACIASPAMNQYFGDDNSEPLSSYKKDVKNPHDPKKAPHDVETDGRMSSFEAFASQWNGDIERNGFPDSVQKKLAKEYSMTKGGKEVSKKTRIPGNVDTPMGFRFGSLDKLAYVNSLTATDLKNSGKAGDLQKYDILANDKNVAAIMLREFNLISALHAAILPKEAAKQSKSIQAVHRYIVKRDSDLRQ